MLPAASAMMQMPRLKTNEKKLLKLFKALSSEEQISVLDFAEYLSERSHSEVSSEDSDQPVAGLVDPILIEPPDNESVIAGLKRLSAVYHMLPKERLLDKTANLMTAHIVQGRPADKVIAELEDIFCAEYENLKSTHNNIS